MKLISDVYRAFLSPILITLDRDQLEYCDLAREQRAYELVREEHVLTAARINSRNSALTDKEMGWGRELGLGTGGGMGLGVGLGSGLGLTGEVGIRGGQ